MQRTGNDTPEVASALAHYINTSTGRGDLPSFLASSGNALSTALFSPRLLASRVEVLNPYYYAKLPAPVRAEAIKSLLSFGAEAVTVLSLAKLAGAQVSTDPTNADFGKIKVGNTRYDILAGFQQPIRALAQIWAGKITSSTTGKEITLQPGYGKMTRLDILSRFFQSKESPIVSLIASALRGTNQVGDPFSAGPEVISRVIPMVVQDMYDASKELKSPGAGMLMGIPEVFGVGMQTYGSQVPTLKLSASGKPSVKMASVSGLPQDIWAKITHQPAIPNQIPDNGLTQAMQAEQQKTIDKGLATTQAQSGNMKNVGVFQPIVLPDGTVKVIDTSFTPKEPILTGMTELDKKAITKYKGEITQKANDIYDLYQAGKISQADAEQQIADLTAKSKALTASTAKPKKVSFGSFKTTAPKLGRVSNIKIKIPKFKLPKAPKTLSSKKIKVKNIAVKPLTKKQLTTTIKLKA
jgi:hypothetical protein